MRPTSPLEIIPIPTFMAFDLFLKNKSEGSPQPTSLVTIATTITIEDRNSTSKLNPVKLTCAPIIAKNKGANIISNLSTYSSTCLIILVQLQPFLQQTLLQLEIILLQQLFQKHQRMKQ